MTRADTTLADSPAFARPGTPKLAPLAKITLVSLVVPALLVVGGLSLTPSRLVFLVVTVPLIFQLFSGKFGKIVLTDILVLFFTFWMLLSIFVNNSSVAVIFGGMQALTLVGGYMVGRATIRSVRDFQALARFFVVVVLCLLPFALYEAMTSVPLPFQLINAIPGLSTIPPVPSTPRLGIDRAQVVFSHPIHFGLFCSLPISLYYVGLNNHEPQMKRAIIASAVLGTCFLSVSSGPLLAGAFQLAMIGYMITTRSLGKLQWTLLLSTLGVLYAVLEVLSSRSAIYAIAERLAFDPATANIRRILWEVGSAQVAKAPILGVGYNSWDHPPWMTGSIDNYWLAMAIIHGLPASMAMFLTYMILMIGAGRGKLKRDSDLYYARVAATFVLVSLTLTIATVAIWGEVLSAVYFLLGSFAFLLQKDVVMADQRSHAEIMADTAEEGARQGRRPTRTEDKRRPVRPVRAPATLRRGGSDQPRFTRFAPVKKAMDEA